MSKATGSDTPGWVIWVIVAGFLAVIVCGVEAAKKSGPGSSPSPTVSVR